MTKELAISLLNSKHVYLTLEGKRMLEVHNKRKKGLERKMRSWKTIFKTIAWMLVELFPLEVILYKEVCFNVQTHCPLR
ncbi:hypothetical protein CN510_15925 [Priestia megaterium]|nr:hypothetical protein CN510_15925 [Priestia megaterium]